MGKAKSGVGIGKALFIGAALKKSKPIKLKKIDLDSIIKETKSKSKWEKKGDEENVINKTKVDFNNNVVNINNIVVNTDNPADRDKFKILTEKSLFYAEEMKEALDAIQKHTKKVKDQDTSIKKALKATVQKVNGTKTKDFKNIMKKVQDAINSAVSGVQDQVGNIKKVLTGYALYKMAKFLTPKIWKSAKWLFTLPFTVTKGLWNLGKRLKGGATSFFEGISKWWDGFKNTKWHLKWAVFKKHPIKFLTKYVFKKTGFITLFKTIKNLKVPWWTYLFVPDAAKWFANTMFGVDENQWNVFIEFIGYAATSTFLDFFKSLYKTFKDIVTLGNIEYSYNQVIQWVRRWDTDPWGVLYDGLKSAGKVLSLVAEGLLRSVRISFWTDLIGPVVANIIYNVSPSAAKLIYGWKAVQDFEKTHADTQTYENFQKLQPLMGEIKYLFNVLNQKILHGNERTGKYRNLSPQFVAFKMLQKIKKAKDLISDSNLESWEEDPLMEELNALEKIGKTAQRAPTAVSEGSFKKGSAALSSLKEGIAKKTKDEEKKKKIRSWKDSFGVSYYGLKREEWEKEDEEFRKKNREANKEREKVNKIVSEIEKIYTKTKTKNGISENEAKKYAKLLSDYHAITGNWFILPSKETTSNTGGSMSGLVNGISLATTGKAPIVYDEKGNIDEKATGKNIEKGLKYAAAKAKVVYEKADESLTKILNAFLGGGIAGGGFDGGDGKAVPFCDGSNRVIPCDKHHRGIKYANGIKKVGGTRSWRTNNPGNIKACGSVASKYTKFGVVGCDHPDKEQQAIFRTMGGGLRAQMDLVKRAYGNETALTIGNRYQEGQTATAYGNNIINHAAKFGVQINPNKKIRNFTERELAAFVIGQIGAEGFVPGKIVMPNGEIKKGEGLETVLSSTNFGISSSGNNATSSGSGGSGGGLLSSATGAVKNALNAAKAIVEKEDYELDKVSGYSGTGTSGVSYNKGGDWKTNLKPELIKAAVNTFKEFQSKVNKHILIISAYRSPQHNAKVGGAGKSCHLSGRAIDIAVIGWSKEEICTFLKIAGKNGFRGFGVYGEQPRSIHVDICTARFWGPSYHSGSFPSIYKNCISEAIAAGGGQSMSSSDNSVSTSGTSGSSTANGSTTPSSGNPIKDLQEGLKELGELTTQALAGVNALNQDGSTKRPELHGELDVNSCVKH